MLPPYHTDNIYIYPKVARILLPRLAELNYRDWIDTWFIWRREMPDGTDQFNQVHKRQYVVRDKQELSREVSDGLNSAYIGIIVPDQYWRVYIALYQRGEEYYLTPIIPEFVTNLHKFKIEGMKADDWGIYYAD